MRSIYFATGFLLGISVTVSGQELSLDSLLNAHGFEIAVTGDAWSGPGVDLILDAAAGAQFVAIAEEHNLKELNEFAAALFDSLHQRYGFNYVALEQGSVIASWLGDGIRRGDLSAMVELIHRYPHAPTFGTNEELGFIAAAGSISTAAINPIWGVDQELGGLHIIERLTELAPSGAARAKLEELAVAARKYELDRFGDVHYLSEVLRPDELTELPALFAASSDAEAVELIAALQRTNRIYNNYVKTKSGALTGYENGREREQSMKLRFMENYRAVQAAGDTLPRALAKLGHWHVLRGLNRSYVTTFGDFLSEFSLGNQMETFIISTYVVGSAESWRNTRGMFAELDFESPAVIIDLRPLRPYAFHGKIAGLSDASKRLLFTADAALVIRGGQTGSYEFVRGANPE